MDYFDHNFRFSDSKRIIIRDDTEDPQELIREIQDAIVSHHVHLCASFARCRIRDCALSIEDLITDDCKETHKYAQRQPLYARVNTLRTTTNDVVNMFVSEGFVLAEDAELSELTGKMFRKDPHFEDMLVFSNECKDDVYSHNITLDLWLCPQVKHFYQLFYSRIYAYQTEIAYSAHSVNAWDNTRILSSVYIYLLAKYVQNL